MSNLEKYEDEVRQEQRLPIHPSPRIELSLGNLEERLYDEATGTIEHRGGQVCPIASGGQLFKHSLDVLCFGDVGGEADGALPFEFLVDLIDGRFPC